MFEICFTYDEAMEMLEALQVAEQRKRKHMTYLEQIGMFRIAKSVRQSLSDLESARIKINQALEPPF